MIWGWLIQQIQSSVFYFWQFSLTLDSLTRIWASIPPSHQRVARCLFWLSRRDRDFASFSLVPRDETEICSIKLSLFNLHGHKKFACTFVMCFGAEWKITTTCTNSIGPSLYYHDQWGWGWMGSAWRNSDYSSGGPAGQPTRPQTNPTLIFIIMVARKSHLCLGGKKRKSSEYPHCTAIHHSLPNDEPLI